MKKIISSLVILSMAVLILGPALTIAEEGSTSTEPVLTEQETSTTTEPSLVEPSEGEGSTTTEENIITTEFNETGTTTDEDGLILDETAASPVIKAAWAMQGPFASLLGTDDDSEAGAQFLPSGQYQISKPISVCALISDASGITDIDSVSAEIYYPMASFGQDIQDGRTGCGQKKVDGQMAQLAKEEGIALFCETIKNNNANLVEFYDIYNFDGICGETGELQMETAAVFCQDAELLYNDLPGEYKVLVFGRDKGGLASNIFQGVFSYLELTAFETDFSNLNYGNVVLNSIKTLEGDLNWNDPKAENQATVRNVGNTRLQISVSQNDMGLGKTEGVWNIRYGSKVGQSAAWQNYWPEETILLGTILGLSSMDQIDFTIEVLRFPEDDISHYAGKMTLDAQKTEHFVCQAE